MHNPINKRCVDPQIDTNCSAHSFPDFESPGRQHPDLLGRDGDFFRRVEFVKGQFVAADGVGEVSPGDDERAVDVEKQAFGAGYQEGMLAGRQAVEAELQLLVQHLHKTVDEVNRIGRELYASAHTHAVTLALAVARKIIGREVAVNRSVVVHCLQQALEGLAAEAEVTVVMHPDDLKFIKTLSPGELPEMNESAGNVTFDSDADITPGGCVVRTAAGDRDASIDGQLEVVAMAFEEALQRCIHRDLTAEMPDDRQT